MITQKRMFKIIDTIVWVCATIGILFMIVALHELKEVNKEVKELKTIMRK